MTPKHTTYDPNDSAVAVRDIADGEGGAYRITAPISSDQAARDGQTFTREKLEAFRNDIVSEEQPVPLMVDHGKSDFGGDSRYSVLGRIGTVDSAELTRDGDTTLLTAQMSVADPDALAEEGDAGEIEDALRYIRFQAENFGLSFSVGWDEDSARTGEPSLLEVSAVALPSDVAASTAGVEPTEAATRGFEALPSRDTSPPEDWGFRGYEPSDPTDEERAVEALETLEHVREFHTQDSDTPIHKRRDETPQGLATIDEILRQFGYSSSSGSVEDRLEALDGDDRRSTREREDLLARLETVGERTRKLAQPETGRPSVRGQTAVYPFGRTADESYERISDAVETLRDVLTEDEEIAGWGMQAIAEGDR